MAKKKTKTKIISYGRYTQWDKTDKNLPKLIKITDTIPAKVQEEFGLIIEFKKGKGKTLYYRIKHPPIIDEDGQLMPDFEGEYFIKTNNYRFFIGDCIWEPVEEKKGIWEITVWLANEKIAEKKFNVTDKEEL